MTRHLRQLEVVASGLQLFRLFRQLRPLWLMAVLLLMVVVVSLHHVAWGFDTTNFCAVNRTITFLQPCALTGSNAVSGTQYSTGVRIALDQYNADGGFGKVRFEVLVVDDQYNATLSKQLVQQQLASHPEIFAILGPVGTAIAQATIPVTTALKVPYIGARSGGLHLVREPFNRYVINYRASYLDEAAAIVQLLVRLGNTRIAVFYQNDSFGESVLQGVLSSLSSSNLRLHSQGYHSSFFDDEMALDDQILVALNAMNSTGRLPPDAVVMGTVNIPATRFVMAVRDFWPDIYVAGVSAVVSDILISTLNATGGARLIKNLYTSQVVPMADDRSHPVVVKYLEAIERFAPSSTPSVIALEAYLATLTTIDALERSRGVLTREQFLDAIFDNGYVNLHGMRCGPFLPPEDQGGCNQCMHQVILTKATVTAGIQLVDHENPYFNFTTCGYKPKQWQTIRFGQSCSFTGTKKYNCVEFRDGLLAAFREVNDGGGIRGTTKLDLVWKDDLDNDTLSRQINVEFLNDASVFGLLGTSSEVMEQIISMASKLQKPMLGSYSGDMHLREPFNRFVLNFRASWRDEIAALIHYCYYTRRIDKIALLQEDSSFGANGRDLLTTALKAKRLELHSEAVFARDESNLTNAVLHLFDETDCAPEAIVCLGNSDVLGGISRTVHSQDTNVLVLGLSTASMTSAAHFFALPSTPSQVNMQNVVISQCVPSVNDTRLRAVQDFTQALTTYDNSLSPTIAGLEGYLVGMFVVTSLQRVLGMEITPSSLIDAMYDSGSFNLKDVRCGPVVDDTASGSVSSETITNGSTHCNQCMKRVWLMGFHDNGSARSIDFDFGFDSCMYKASPNVDFQLHGMRLAMIVVASVGNLYVVVIIGLLIRHRNHQFVHVSFKFSVVSCLGAILCFSSVYLLYPIPTNTTCALEPWAADISFVMLFGPLFVKTHHIDQVFNNRKLRKRLISDTQVLADFTAILLVFAIFLVFWTLASRRRMEEAWTLDGYRYETCVSPINSFQLVAFAMKTFTLLWGCFLCQRVYRLDNKFAHFNESKQLVICICSTSLMGSIALVLMASVKDPNVYFALFTSLLMLNTFVTVTVFFIFPLYVAVNRIEVVSTLSTTMNPSTKEATNTSVVAPLGRKNDPFIMAPPYRSVNTSSVLDPGPMR